MELFDGSTTQLVHPSATLVAFINGLRVGSSRNVDSERRGYTRQPTALPVLVQPVDESHKPLGNFFSAVARDLSNSGIGMVCTQAIAHDYLALRLFCGHAKTIDVAAKVCRCRDLGDGHYDVGCNFMTKLE